MGLKVFLEVENTSHRRRIEYVLRNFALAYKIDLIFVDSIDGVNEDDLLIFYGKNFPASDRTIFIAESEQAVELFENRKAYDEVYELATIHYVKLSPPLVPEKFDGFNLPVFFKVGEPVFEFESGFKINFDILSCAFYFLSAWDERVKSSRDEFGRFPDEENLLVKIGIADLPIVNFYFHILKALVQNLGFAVDERKWDGKSFALCVTHDVDVLRKWSAFGIYNEVMNKFIMGKDDIQLRRQRFAKFLYFLSKGIDPYREGMRKIFKFEKSLNVKSTFFMKSGGGTKYDARYKWDEFLLNFVKDVKNSGFEVGLHPSFDTFDKVEKMEEEKKKIEEIANVKVEGVRQHYLRYDLRITPFIHDALGFRYDSTLGFISRVGFRCGYAFPFKIFDIERGIELKTWEIPLVFMDAVYQYGRSGEKIEEILVKALELVEVVRSFGGVMTVLFHNSVYDEFDFEGWNLVYEGVIKFALEKGALVGSCSEILESFTN